MTDTQSTNEILPGTPAWYDARLSGIGGSDAAAAVGLHPYRTPLHVYAEKRGEIEPEPENDAMRLGKALEPVVVAEFVRRSGLQVRQRPVALQRHPEWSWMLGTPDAILGDDELLEAKTGSRWAIADRFGDEDSDEVPEEYLIQCQHYLELCGSPICHLALLIDGRTLRTYRIERNERLIGHLIAAEEELWQRIADGRPPEPDWTHPRTGDLLRDLYDQAGETRVELDEEAAEWLEEKERLGRQIREIKQRQEEVSNKLLAAVGDAGGGILPGGDKELRKIAVAEKEIRYTRKPYVYLRKCNASDER